MFSFIVNIPLELLSLWKMEGFFFFLICLSLAEYHWQNYNFELGSKNSFLIQLWTIACLWSTVRCLFFLFTGYINEIVHTMLEHVDSEKIVLFCFIIHEGEIPPLYPLFFFFFLNVRRLNEKCSAKWKYQWL